jgi:DNA primase catalytic subunit
MSFDKTNFLVVDHITHASLKAYRRRRGYMLFRGDEPQRRIEWDKWRELQAEWPNEVARNKLSVGSVWFLEEVPIK